MDSVYLSDIQAKLPTGYYFVEEYSEVIPSDHTVRISCGRHILTTIACQANESPCKICELSTNFTQPITCKKTEYSSYDTVFVFECDHGHSFEISDDVNHCKYCYLEQEVQKMTDRPIQIDSNMPYVCDKGLMRFKCDCEKEFHFSEYMLTTSGKSKKALDCELHIDDGKKFRSELIIRFMEKIFNVRFDNHDAAFVAFAYSRQAKVAVVNQETANRIQAWAIATNTLIIVPNDFKAMRTLLKDIVNKLSGHGVFNRNDIAYPQGTDPAVVIKDISKNYRIAPIRGTYIKETASNSYSMPNSDSAVDSSITPHGNAYHTDVEITTSDIPSNNTTYSLQQTSNPDIVRKNNNGHGNTAGSTRRK